MTKVKICGIRTKEDCLIMNTFKPDFVGVVFADSRHKVNERQACIIRNTLNINIPIVGVFVDDDINKIVSLYDAGIIQYIQLHGDENDEYIKLLKNKLCLTANDITDEKADEIIIKAFRIKDTNSIENIYYCEEDKVLIDAFDDNLKGGSGKRIKDEYLSSIFNVDKKIIIAGGINKDNVKEIIEKYNPYAIDISTSLEEDNHKDYDKVKEFFDIYKEIRNEKVLF